MRKSVLIAGLAAAALAGVNSNSSKTTASNEVNVKAADENPSGQQNDQQNQANKSEQSALPERRRIVYRSRNGRYAHNGGVPPKDWGMYLQRTRRQKWNKRIS